MAKNETQAPMVMAGERMTKYVWDEVLQADPGTLVRCYATANAAQVAVYRLRRDPYVLDAGETAEFHIRELETPYRGLRWGVFTGVKTPAVVGGESRG